MTALLRDRGAAEVLALVLIAPACVGLALLVVSIGRSVESVAQVRSAAESAAQAAALERDAYSAANAAERVAAELLVDADTCRDPAVIVDVSAFRPGGSVGVTIVCNASDRGVEPSHTSGRVFSARAVAHIDQYRAGHE